MKKTARSIALILAAILMLAALVSCGEKTVEAGQTSQTGETGKTEETVETFELGDKIFDFDIEEYVKMPDFSTLKIKKSELDDKVNESINSLLVNVLNLIFVGNINLYED